MSIKERFKELNLKNKILAICVVVIITILVLLFILFNNDKVVTAVEKFNKKSSEDCIVEIRGEVNRTGIYSIDSNARVNDLIILAQGLTNNADTTGLNLAAKVTDGMVLVIPSIVIGEDNNTNKLSINTATKEELMDLDGIGEARALAIIEYRVKSGGFKTIDELVEQKIISENVYNKIKEHISV